MKRFLLILGGVIALLFAVLLVCTWFTVSGLEKDKNRDKTSAARKARWQPKADEAEIVSESQTNGQSHEPEVDAQTEKVDEQKG